MAQLSRLVALLCLLVAASLTCQLFIIFTREEATQPFADMSAGLTPAEMLRKEGLIRQAAKAKGWLAEVEEGLNHQDAKVERQKHQAAEGLNTQGAVVKEGLEFKHHPAEPNGALGREGGFEGLEQLSAAELRKRFEQAGEENGFQRQSMSRQMLGENPELAHHLQQYRRAADNSKKTGGIFSDRSHKVDPNLSDKMDKIEKALIDLFARGDSDLTGLPVAVYVRCGEGEEGVTVVGGGGKLQVCIDKLLVLESIHATTMDTEFEKATIYDLKVALLSTLVDMVGYSMYIRVLQILAEEQGDDGKAPLSRDVLFPIYRSALDVLTDILDELDSREQHPDQQNYLFKTANSHGEGFMKRRDVVQGGADDGGLLREQVGGQHMERGDELAKHALSFKAEEEHGQVGGKEAAEVLLSNKIDVSDGAGGERDKGGGGLAELERVLPPLDDIPSNPEDENEYELEDADAGAGGAGVQSKLQEVRRKPARLSWLGPDYVAMGPYKNARDNLLFPPSNPVFGGGAGEVQAIPSSKPSPLQSDSGNVQDSESKPGAPSLFEGNATGKKSAESKRTGHAHDNLQFGSKRVQGKEKKRQHRKFLLSPKLYQLVGSPSPNYGSLQERGFAERYHFNSSDLRDRSKYVQEVVSALERSLWEKAMTSLNRDLMERGKFQRHQTDQFCGRNKMSKVLPSRMEQLDSLFKHLLYDDSKRIVVCYVPKNGCSNLKRMMLVLNGILPPASSSNKYKRPSEELLGSVHSFRNLTREQAIYKLKNYYKFAIVRNPLERLLSAYKNKLETPLNASMRKKFPNRLKAYLLDLYAHDQLKSWILAQNYAKDIHPSFQHLLKFMTQFSLSSYNEHFMPFLQLCFPCAIDYDLVINFKTLNYDMYALMDYLNVPPSYYPAVVGHETPTSSYMKQYYGLVPAPIKKELFEKLEQELDFYYTLHPEEEGMHRDL